MPGEELTPTELAALECETEEQALDARMIAALEYLPDLSAITPRDFAARVAAKVPSKRVPSIRQTHYGRNTIWIGLGVLLLSLALISMKGLSNSVVDAAVEWTLCAQLMALAIWLTVRLRSSS
jgi:hypothetical protein